MELDFKGETSWLGAFSLSVKYWATKLKGGEG